MRLFELLCSRINSIYEIRVYLRNSRVQTRERNYIDTLCVEGNIDPPRRFFFEWIRKELEVETRFNSVTPAILSRFNNLVAIFSHVIVNIVVRMTCRDAKSVQPSLTWS